MMNLHEQRFLALIRAAGLPEPENEYRFHPVRRWRFDFAWPAHKVAVEIEGGRWVMGRHNHPQGFQNDCIKYNAAALLGWRVFRYTPEMLGDAVAQVEEALKEDLEK
jgi:very-short-patch-repair endonuclease